MRKCSIRTTQYYLSLCYSATPCIRTWNWLFLLFKKLFFSSSQNRLLKPRRGVEVWFFSSFNPGAGGGGGGWSTPCLGRFTPGNGSQYPFYRNLIGPQGRSGRVRTILPPPVFDPQTVQPVVSRHTDYAILVHTKCYHGGYYKDDEKEEHAGTKEVKTGKF